MSRLLPRPTVRLKLTLVYAGLFLVAGTLLLGVSYALVKRNVSADPRGGRPYFRPGSNGKLTVVLGGGAHGEGATTVLLPKSVTRAPPGGVAPPLPGTLAGPGPRSAGLPPGASRAQIQAVEQIRRAVRRQLVSDALHRLVIQYLIALVALFLAALGLGWVVAGRVLKPLKRITATAKRVSGQTLHERIGLEGPADELKELADTFDGMLGRLDQAFESQRRFVANASHELRTPLTVMRTEVEVTLADPDASTAELRAMATTVREAIERSDQLVEGLLTLASSDSGDVGEEPADLAALADATLEDHREALELAGIEARATLDHAPVNGDPRLLERLVWNLVENGIRHNGGDWLAVTTAREGGDAILVVSNAGRVIAPETAATLVAPFRRATDRTGAGFGLGLSIVCAVADAHGGETRVHARPEGGLRVEVRLPAGRDAAGTSPAHTAALAAPG
ncbi:MAG: sensor histidine kinase [Solirubrobacteraceae bacterium]|nr:MAG: two-component sensor histidine kinase [Solirubrobacterales bacterium]